MEKSVKQQRPRSKSGKNRPRPKGNSYKRSPLSPNFIGPLNQNEFRVQRGDMSVSAPIAKSVIRQGSKPRMQGLPNGDILISHREFISDISGSVAFTNNTFAVNPGQNGTFPWLNAIAQRFESYNFEKLVFEFETQSATSATGTVLITLDYDAADAAPVNKTQALGYRSSVRSPPWASCKHTSMREDLSKNKSSFVRSGALAANLDIKLYDIANAYVSTQGQAGTSLIGELYVEYSVRFYTPLLGDARQGEALWAAYSGSSNAAPFATKIGNLPATVSSTGTTTSITTLTFTQPWSGFVTCTVVGTGLAGINPTGTATSAEVIDVINTGLTNEVDAIEVDADAGQTLIITISNTTITGTNVLFGQSAGNP